MTPSFARVLSGAAEAINNELVAHFRTDQAALGHASMIRLLMLAVSEEADRAPDTLMTEIAALRLLFATAAERSLHEGLRNRLLASANAGAPDSFTTTALGDFASSMKAVLIDLHAELEEISTPWARALEAQVWDILRLGADRRQLNLRGL